MLLFFAYVLQQRFVPFLSLRTYLAAVSRMATQMAAQKRDAVVETANVLATLNPVRRGRSPLSAPAPSAAVKHVAPMHRRAWFEPGAQDLSQLRTSSVLGRLRLRNAVVLVGVAMQRVMADYNNLESTYLITALLVLIAGMVFQSNGFPEGTPGYHIVSALVALIIIFATLSFILLLGVELYKSFRDAELHAALRASEAASVEAALRQGVRSRRELFVQKTKRLAVARDESVQWHGSGSVSRPVSPPAAVAAAVTGAAEAVAVATPAPLSSDRLTRAMAMQSAKAAMGSYFAAPQRIRGVRRTVRGHDGEPVPVTARDEEADAVPATALNAGADAGAGSVRGHHGAGADAGAGYVRQDADAAAGAGSARHDHDVDDSAGGDDTSARGDDVDAGYVGEQGAEADAGAGSRRGPQT
jgi:hypothetical protein